ncbi:MAG: bis(5'-nucleosyl)-tetraphosphatase (symmetrical) YqeK [Clostridia bacterium]|nr:bis(5'-nucleosyl)-tetraphosphatase (symmetrical) YqeK [Clostridia bacterium]
MYDLIEIQNAVKAHLKPSRYIHTLGVVAFAEKLAEIHGGDLEKVRVAAWLHDYAKYASDGEILEILMANDLMIHPVVENHLNLAHGQVSALLAKEKFSIMDDEIIKAISNHTFGCPHMTLTEKIIYLADGLEENRKYEGVENLRELAFKSLDQGIIAMSTSTILYELKQGHMIHENTILMRNSLIAETKVEVS